jgi:hypothetical protein
MTISMNAFLCLDPEVQKAFRWVEGDWEVRAVAVKDFDEIWRRREIAQEERNKLRAASWAARFRVTT